MATNNVQNLATPFLAQMQKMEYVLYDLRNMRLLTNAIGAQLDGCGQIVGLGRNNLSDSDFLTAIHEQVQYNISSGQPETILQYFRNIGSMAQYREPAPGQITIKVSSVPANPLLLKNLRPLIPAGVSIEIDYIADDSLALGLAEAGGFPTTGKGLYEAEWPESHGYTAGVIAERFTI